MSKSPLFYELLRQVGAEALIRALAPYVTERRQARALSVIENRLSSIHTAVEQPADIHNALAIVRTAEALGLLHMHLIGHPKKRKGRQTMRGADRWVDLCHYSNFPEFMEAKQKKGLLLYGAAPRGEVSLEEIPIDRPFCVLFGNEKEGLSQEATEACDLLFRVPMHGFCESFNVSVSAGIILHTLGEKRRTYLRHKKEKKEGVGEGKTRLLGASKDTFLDANMCHRSISDLSDSEKREELAWLYLATVGIESGKKLVLAAQSKA